MLPYSFPPAEAPPIPSQIPPPFGDCSNTLPIKITPDTISPIISKVVIIADWYKNKGIIYPSLYRFSFEMQVESLFIPTNWDFHLLLDGRFFYVFVVFGVLRCFKIGSQ